MKCLCPHCYNDYTCQINIFYLDIHKQNPSWLTSPCRDMAFIFPCIIKGDTLYLYFIHKQKEIYAKKYKKSEDISSGSFYIHCTCQHSWSTKSQWTHCYLYNTFVYLQNQILTGVNFQLHQLLISVTCVTSLHMTNIMYLVVINPHTWED